MPAQRKVFRIEQMAMPATGAPSLVSSAPSMPHPDIIAELKALRELIDRRSSEEAAHDPMPIDNGGLYRLKQEADSIQRAISRTRHEIATVQVHAFDGGRRTHVKHQLGAVAGSAERATQQILDAAEEIEDAADSLGAALKCEQERALAQDIQDHAVRIFEACNFQDLNGQRINKVIATLQFVEERIARMMTIWGGMEAFREHTAAAIGERGALGVLHGPKLDGDLGHATQADVDRLFEAE
jgi:chemotaxis protein CheZ